MRDFHHAARFNPVGESVTTIFASSPRIVPHHPDQPLKSGAPLIPAQILADNSPGK